jgi:crotonobetainyl-CoA:carnitine CoA-transferase CaiB-like acyl-CoA transferase
VTSSSQPLAGIRVVCIAIYVPALVAAQRLREFGAAVTVIEPPAGDPFAKACPAWYQALRAAQSVAVLDLKSADGAARLTSLLASSDLLMTALRPAALDRLGLSWAALHARHPTLCHVAIVGYPSPNADEPGHDLTYQARAGLLQPPTLPRALVADMAGAERATQAALALLFGRERGQGAERCEVALAAAVDSFADGLRFGLTKTGALLGGGLPGYGLYETSDGWVAVAALEPHFWHGLVSALGLTEHNADHASLARFFKSQSAMHWEKWAAERLLPVVAVRAGPHTPAGGHP